jgi:hypothetical protein
MRIFVGLTAVLLGACSSGIPGTSAREHQFKIAESGGPYVSNETKFESLGTKTLERGQKYRITEAGGRSSAPYFLVADITQYVGGRKGDVANGAMLFVEDGSAEYDCEKWLSDRRISETEEDTPVVSCNFKFIGVLPIPETATVQKDQSAN